MRGKSAWLCQQKSKDRDYAMSESGVRKFLDIPTKIYKGHIYNVIPHISC